ncbi:MAG: hypothetical protein P8X74_09005 [Reinekea sp.]
MACALRRYGVTDSGLYIGLGSGFFKKFSFLEESLFVSMRGACSPEVRKL